MRTSQLSSSEEKSKYLEKLKHLEWTIKSRNANQVCTLRLLRLFSNFEDKWKTKKYSRAAQDLTAVAFSLWRAAFLADKTGKRGDVFAHAKTFLEKLIEDNAIAYLQDKTSREWTFNYYTRNARSSLQQLHEYWKNEAPEYDGKKRNARERWEYCHELLDQAVTGFEKRLNEEKTLTDKAEHARTTRIGRKVRRAKVREMTLANKVK